MCCKIGLLSVCCQLCPAALSARFQTRSGSRGGEKWGGEQEGRRSPWGSGSRGAWLSPLTFHLDSCGRCCWEGWGFFSAWDDVGLLGREEGSSPFIPPRGAGAPHSPGTRPRLHPVH